MNEEWEDAPEKIGKDKKIKPYRSTKRKIKKFIPKDKDLSHISIIDDRGKQGRKIIDTDDIKEQASNAFRSRREFYELDFKLYNYKEELRLLKRELPVLVSAIDRYPKEIEDLKATIKDRNFLIKKEEQSPGFLNQTREGYLAKVRKEMEENDIKEEVRRRREQYISQHFDLEGLRESIEIIETRIKILLEVLEESKDSKITKLQKIEELEEKIQELEPVVIRLREEVGKKLKKLKARRNINLMKLFNKEGRPSDKN